jgi:predicted Rossmann fold nucleotide-binding protein DprA/Smf involved in DNA uptake
MKVAVIGSRSFNDYEKLKDTLSKISISLLVSGGANGADKLGEQYAN